MTVLLEAPIDVSTLDFHTYDGYVDSLGLVYHEGQGSEQLSQSIPTEAQRQDTGNNPDEIRAERGFFFAQSDFSGGMGQEKFHAQNADKNKYLNSFGFDISERGKLTHLKELSHTLTTNCTAFAISNSGELFVADNSTAKRTSDLSSWTNDTPVVAVVDMTTSGNTLFTCSAGGNGVYKRDSGGVWSQLVTSGTIQHVNWMKDRLMVVTSETIHEITSLGAPAALPSAIETLASGWNFGKTWENGPYIYAAVYSFASNKSRVHIYGLNADASAIEKKGSVPIPTGTLILSGAGYLGTMYLVGRERISSTAWVDVVYQAFPDENGFLQYVLLHRANKDGSHAIGFIPDIATHGEGVLIPWTSLFDTAATDDDIEHAGILHHNLARDALSHHVAINDVDALRANTTTIYNDKIVIGAKDGVYYEASTYVDEATLITSEADFNSAALKVWDKIEVDVDPLPADTSISVYYTTKDPDEDDWTLAGTIDTTDSTGDTFRLTDVESRRLALKFVSSANAGGTAAPTIRGYSVRGNPKPETSEWSLVRTFKVTPEIRSHPKGRLVLQDPRALVTSLRNKLHTWVTLYEPGEVWTAYVKDMRVVEPKQAHNKVTGGSKEQEAYIVTFVMEGTRS